MRDKLVNLFDFERAAAECLPAHTLDYYRSGAHDELTLRDNRAAFERIQLYYRVLVDVSRRSLETRVLGQSISFPALVAPTAFHKLAHPDGELASVRAAGAARTAFILSTLSNTRVEDVVKVASGPVWFQLYVYKDRAVTEALVRRVEAAGVQALVLTVDAPLLGTRERDVRNQFRLPPALNVVNLLPEGKAELPTSAGSALALYFAELLDPSLSWKDLSWLATITTLPIVVKGIVRADDARRAADHGARAVVISNHGGRQLDTSPATIDVLPRIADAVGQHLELLLDGGVRRGTDILKALACGARAVLIGRPILWGLAVDGEHGARRVLEILESELDLALALAGCPSVTEVDRDLVTPH